MTENIRQDFFCIRDTTLWTERCRL